MLQIILLVVAISTDSFLAALAYGVEKITIPLKSVLLIAFLGVLFLGVSLSTASFLQQFIPLQVCKYISFTIFLIIALSSLFQGTIKQFLRVCKKKKLTFSYSNISFVLDVYLDETKADRDHSKQLSLKEALYLGVALSFDSLVSGFALGMGIKHPSAVLIISFIIGAIAIYSGSILGERSAKTSKDINLSCLSGFLFLCLAILKIM